jgi:hypothetical protein
MRRQALLLLPLVGLVFVAGAVHAQTAARSPEHRFWGAGGAGVGVLPGADRYDATEGLAGSLNAAYQFNRHLFSVRATNVGELFGDNFSDYGLLYGRVLAQTPLFVSVGTGLAYVDGRRSEGLFSDPEPVDATVGVPLEAQVSLRPLRFVGIGLYTFANVNGEESFFGATVSIQIGLLR